MIQEYPSKVYQPGTVSPDPNIILIQPSLEITDSPFASSEILALDLLLPTSGTPINITLLNEPISYILYISPVPSTSPISDQFSMENRCIIYVVAIENEDPALATTAIQII